jgi:RNA polymerase sigma factor (sigma-70 family)
LKNLPKQPISNGIEVKGEKRRLPRFGKEVKLLELTTSQKKTVRHQFDSFCRKILREEVRDYIRELTRLAEHEVFFSELSEEQLERLSVLDEYPSDLYHFDVHGHHVVIRDDRLAEALSSLSEYQRTIVLLSYFLDMNDCEIAEKLNMVRRTVQYRRTSSITKMRERMEAKINGGQSE